MPLLAAFVNTLDALDGRTVTIGGVTSGDDIIDAIKRWEKRNGTDWRQ